MQINPILIYHRLFNHFGPQYWWPMDIDYHQKQGSDPRFEIMVGAILTQNTAWSNVEKALINLKNNKILTITTLTNTPIDTVKELIKPSGFFNQKAHRLLILSTFLFEKYNSNLDDFFSNPSHCIRTELLSLIGIGPETADSILLYAGKKPFFVIDAYTKRLCDKLQLLNNSSSYNEIQLFFQNDIAKQVDTPQIVPIFSEFHAVIVEWAKQYCTKKNPQCTKCPLQSLCKKKQN